MLCQNCGEREATIHEVTIRNGSAVEHHLCEACAAELGMHGSAPPSMAELLPGLISSGLGVPSEPASSSKPTQPNPNPATRPPSCASCGMTFADFKRSGLLGCARCYETFEERLGPLIERAHEGGSHHVGKVPRRALDDSRRGAHPERLAALLGDQKEREERLTSLRKQLERAVGSEQYERAAALRDEIRKVSSVDGDDAGHVTGDADG